jgi:peptidoglycan pentaglycine glycine transferase (the first glycine)
MPIVDRSSWSEFLSSCPQAHILQSPAWGKLKAAYGWTPAWLINGSLGAQVLFQDLPLGFTVAYITRGPVVSQGPVFGNAHWAAFQDDIDSVCREHKAVFLKIEPDGWMEEAEEPREGWKLSSHSIQPPRTIVVSLEGAEDQILERMKSKTRYNIRLADRKGVSVRRIEDLEPFYALLEFTAERAEFGIHTREYYRKAFELFHPAGECALFLAEYQGQPLASIMVFQRGKRSWYFYGASSREHRDLMAPYLVQWEAMRWAKAQGCTSYDLWGVPDQDLEVLEEGFTERSDGLWGVYRFKRGFGGQLLRSPGPWDRVYRPGLYKLYLLRNQLAGVSE